MIILRLPYPPSANRYWRNYRGHMVVSREAKDYREQVAAACAETGIEPLSGAIGVNLRLYRPQKSGDLDNFFKQLLDALQQRAYLNDSQIVELHAFRHDDKDDPHVDVLVWQVECE